MNLSVYRKQDNIMSKNKKMLFKLEKNQLQGYEECLNYLGFNQIEIIEFNYDGEGNALVFEDKEIGIMCPNCLRFLFFSGWYSMIEYR